MKYGDGLPRKPKPDGARELTINLFAMRAQRLVLTRLVDGGGSIEAMTLFEELRPLCLELAPGAPEARVDQVARDLVSALILEGIAEYDDKELKLTDRGWDSAFYTLGRRKPA